MNANPIILLTACINPNGMSNTAIQDKNIRREQYYEALRFYIEKTKFDIVFIDNSGYDISPDFIEYIKDKRLEVLTIDENNFDRKLGKGYGEGLIVKYAIQNSTFINENNVIIKISGRHIVNNINKLFSLSNMAKKSNSFISCDINNNSHSGMSDCFIASYDFFFLFVTKYIQQIDESRHIWFEHVLYQAIVEFNTKGDFIFLPLPLLQNGYSGSTGNKFTPPSTLTYIKHIIKYILYYCKFMGLPNNK